jgi:hypothetical protein
MSRRMGFWGSPAALCAWVGLCVIVAPCPTYSARLKGEPVPLQSSRAPALAQPRFDDSDFTPWLPNRVLLDQLKRDSSRGSFPAYVEGRAENFAIEFRAVLRPKLKGLLSWEVRLNVADSQFEELHQRYAQRGFILYSRSDFTGLQGEARVNGVWIRVRP